MPGRAFTLLELVISLAVVFVLLAVLLPALSSARAASHRAVCADHLRALGRAWAEYVNGNDGRFPSVLVQPGWRYGGVRFSSVDASPFLDSDRPLSRDLPLRRLDVAPEELFRCPADRGITDMTRETGTGRRTAYRAFGTSYRANAQLLQPRGGEQGLHRTDITTAPSRLVVMGDPVWYEVREATGLLADWHGVPDTGNLLFLDGSVRFVTVEPAPAVGAAVFDPVAPHFAFPRAGGKEAGPLPGAHGTTESPPSQRRTGAP